MEIPANVINKFNSVVQMLMQSSLGSTVTIVYPVKRTQCPNCILNPYTGRSSGKYKSGGPFPFTKGECPYCKGDGFIEERYEDVIHCLAVFNPRDYYEVGAKTANVPAGRVKLIFRAADLERVRRGDYFIVEDKDEKYKRASDPAPCGLDREQFYEVFLER